MTVTIYRSTDSGAPVPTLNGNYKGAAFYMSVIKACLVTGYGAKAGAGWSVAYEDTTTDKSRLAVSNGNGVMEFITWGTGSIGMCMWDSITTPGSGRIYDDTFSAVMSVGANGWKSPVVPMSTTASEKLMAIYTLNLTLTNYTNKTVAWTVFADDKSAWILFHYGSGIAASAPGQPLTKSYSYHPQLFMGALKSPELGRSAAGNFYAGYGDDTAGTATNGAVAGTNNYISKVWGLRTPINTVPNPTNSPAFTMNWRVSSSGGYTINPYSPVRLITPIAIAYKGTEAPKPAALSATYSDYIFALFPGVAQLSSESGSGQFWWQYYLAEKATSYVYETQTIGGVDWMPWSLETILTTGITDNSAWW